MRLQPVTNVPSKHYIHTFGIIEDGRLAVANMLLVPMCSIPILQFQYLNDTYICAPAVALPGVIR